MVKSCRSWLFPAMLPLLAVSLSTPAVRCADIQGTVTDYASGRPLDGVRVLLSDDQGNIGPIPTVDGAYKFEAVKVGQYKVSFDFTGYSPRPDNHPCAIQERNESKRVDTELLRDDVVEVNYYRDAGKRFAALVKKDGGKAENYQARWNQLRRFALSPKNKILIVRSISDTDDAASKFLPLRQYEGVEVDRIEKMLPQTIDSLKKGSAPPPSAFPDSLGEEVVADILIYSTRTSKLSPKMMEAVMVSFSKDWKGVKAADLVKTSFENRLDFREFPKER